MHFFYEEGTKIPFTGKPIPYNELPATSYYLKHFKNAMYLKFVASNPLATPIERQQANREIPIADRKMEYWKKHPNYRHEFVIKECEKIKKQWG